MKIPVADAATIRRWREEPPRYVRERFGVEPEPWQDRVLADFPHCQRQAMQACVGPGKTALLAWLGWNFLETRPDPKGAAVSITRDNLRDNLWAELAKWRARSPFLLEQFEWTNSRVFWKGAPETWFIAARAFSNSASPDQLAATLAGIHADYVIFLCDETGAMPPPVVATAENALSSGQEAHVVQAGNPLTQDGALYAATRSGTWKRYEITGDPDDPNRAARVNREWAAEQIRLYGRDDPYVMSRVLGKFPRSAINALLSLEEVEAAAARSYQEDVVRQAARILGVDVARFGDDASVIFPRQGLIAFPPSLHRGLDTGQGANLVAAKWKHFQADATFIDESGGYGAGWIDNLRLLGYQPIGIQFAAQATERLRYANKRAEMHFLKAEWIRSGGQIPPSRELMRALSEATYSYMGDRLLLEPKEQLKQRLGFSPDEDDALALTFAAPVQRAAAVTGRRGVAEVEYDPYAYWHREPGGREGIGASYDPAARWR